MGFNFLKAAKNCTSLVKRNSPLILTCVGIGLGVTSTVMAVKATPEAHDIYKKIQDSDIPEDEKKKEVIKNVVPMYLPSALTGCAAIAAVVGGYKIQADRLAEMTAAYILATNSLQDYKQTILDKFGDDVASDIQKEVSEKQAAKNPNSADDIIISNDGPEEIMQDSISGQYFKSTRDDIWRVLSDIGYRLTIEDCIAASEYFYEVGISQNNLGDDVGWMSGDRPEPRFTPFILPDGRKAVHVQVDTNPAFRGYKVLY
jgi:hypothetical protein